MYLLTKGMKDSARNAAVAAQHETHSGNKMLKDCEGLTIYARVEKCIQERSSLSEIFLIEQLWGEI